MPFTEWSRKNRTDSRHHSYCSEWAKCLKFRFCTPQHMHFSILSGICHMCIFTYIFSHGLKICIFQKSDTNLSLKNMTKYSNSYQLYIWYIKILKSRINKLEKFPNHILKTRANILNDLWVVLMQNDPYKICHHPGNHLIYTRIDPTLSLYQFSLENNIRANFLPILLLISELYSGWCISMNYGYNIPAYHAQNIGKWTFSTFNLLKMLIFG